MLLGGLAYQGGTGVTPSKQGETKSENQLTPVSASNNTADNSSEVTTTDNNLFNTNNMPINHQIKEFCQVYCEVIKAVAGQSISQDTEPEKPSVIKKEMILEPEDGYELAQVSAEFNASKLPSNTECAFKPSENRTTAGSALTSELVLTIDSKEQIASKTVLPQVVAMPLIANCPVEEGKTCDKAPISGKTVVSEKYLANQIIAEKTATEILTDGSKTTADGINVNHGGQTGRFWQSKNACEYQLICKSTQIHRRVFVWANLSLLSISRQEGQIYPEKTRRWICVDLRISWYSQAFFDCQRRPVVVRLRFDISSSVVVLLPSVRISVAVFSAIT